MKSKHPNMRSQHSGHKYVAIIHKHWMGSKGFEVRQLDDAVDIDDAVRYANSYCQENAHTFCHYHAQVLEIPSGVFRTPRQVASERKLTIWERITGRIREA